jgi:DNA polymerase-3 subunit alpha
MSEDKTAEAWSLVEGFAAYGFNRAHSTAYSLLGYQMAYLKVHYPLEFHAALLETSVGTAKEDQYIKETKRVGVSILGACVNRSGVLWTLDTKSQAIRRGLTSIKGVGARAAEAIVSNAPYASIDDVISRCPSNAVTGGKAWAKERKLTGVLSALQKAGALRQLGVMPQ